MSKRKRKNDQRHAKWQAPWDFSDRYLRLSIENWCDTNGKLGWGDQNDPFSEKKGKVTIEVYEFDCSKPRHVDSVKEIGPDDLIATFTGNFRTHKTKTKAALFVPTEAKDPKNNEVDPGKRTWGAGEKPPADYVWINFEGRKKNQAYQFAIPTPKGEDEGLFFEIGFVIKHPKMGKYTEYRSKAVAIRPRHNVVMLNVEPLGQGNWGSLDQRRLLPIHHEIKSRFHPDGKTLNHEWADIVYKWRGYGRPPYGYMKGAGCSITSFTMVLRYLRAPWKKEKICNHQDKNRCTASCSQSIFENKIPKVKELDVKHRPFEREQRAGRWRFREPDPEIKDHWWPIRLVWYARQLANYEETYDTLKKGKKKVTTRLKAIGTIKKYMKSKGYISGERVPDLLKDLGELEIKTLQQSQIKGTLDDGRPVMCCVAGPKDGSLGSHFMVIVGYIKEPKDAKGKETLRFIFNDPGSGFLRHISLTREEIVKSGKWTKMNTEAERLKKDDREEKEKEKEISDKKGEVTKLKEKVKNLKSKLAKRRKFFPKRRSKKEEKVREELKTAKVELKKAREELKKAKKSLKELKDKSAFLWFFEKKWKPYCTNTAYDDIPFEGRWKGRKNQPWTLKPPRRTVRYFTFKPPGWSKDRHSMFSYARVRRQKPASVKK